MLKAIQTRYKGYHFRSRLEARYAVFFDTLGVEWEYEDEGYELKGAGRYLPDFRFRKHYCPLFIEIKPDEPSLQEVYKADCLSKEADAVVIIAAGTPGAEKIWLMSHPQVLTPPTTSQCALWCDLFRPCAHICTRLCPKTSAAYVAARSARFEYGQTPKAIR